ncbi:TP901 family phage tail tape measure protein [Pseudomonas marginalis]|uniref:phage tail tape measure protein n=1 Tax=Pseudomonas marginalis TaxID=298 RepID=UPI00209FA185|nr:phage tail tape measure protein [Pseudomonas marginalis]MCP1508264.1 TP901 family phage tail tape measure protein [Pseudomonas marginalis]MCP1525768.1 TP901 family phage tail tape measure protein [Pseudomonas marginalis]MDQ0498918.1 TP901 family phage tail tape measure protein [Pseudomonas marginalis]
MANDLRLQVLLSTIDKATRPLKHISEGGIETARALKAARDRLKELTSQQKDVSAWRAQRAAAEQTGASLTAARDRVKSLSQELAATDAPTRAMTRSFQSAVREATRLKQQHQQQSVQLQGLRSKLYDAGISTKNLGSHERQLREQINATNSSISTQSKRMAELSAQHKRAAAARSQMEKSQRAASNLAVNGAAGLGVGYAASRPIAAAVKAFAPNEDSATQLKVSMMDDTGKVSEDFQKITDLATKLGDRLPGTTADFQNMMTMLRRQGLSAQSILGGTGEAAAYLGVQLKMEATEAAEFAAKMQDATRTTEKDMMGLMDTIQRGFYAGVDPGNMLQGFSKIAPVMDVIKKSGIDAAKELAPLLIMMDQAGMEGGSAGNAFRKIFQAGLDGDHVNSANKIAAGGNTGVSFKFTDDKGNFAGLENLYAQVEKLKAFNDVDRNAIIKKLFGDDAETLTTLNTMMNKGLAGYQEVQQKLKTQADLRTRVNEQLNTLTNIMEAAEGSFTNAMAEFGAAVAPELKDLIKTLGEIANSIGAWARENPKLAGGLVKVVAAIAALAFVFGGLALTMASMLGPFAVLRYGMTMFGLQGGGITKMLGRLLPTLTGLARNVFPMFAQGVRMLAMTMGGALVTALRTVGIALWGLAANPIVLVIAAVVAALAGGAYLIYKNWDAVKNYFANAWTEIKAGFDGGIGGIITTLVNFSPLGLLYQAFSGVLSYLGIELPSRFTEFGSMIVNGLVNGLTAGLGAVKDTISSIGDASIGWFKEKLGIHSPSRVFAELGGFTMAGLTQGLEGGQKGPLNALTSMSKQLTAAGTLALGATAMPAFAVDNTPPISSAPAAAVYDSHDTYEFSITAGPGTDLQSLEKTVRAMLTRIENEKKARQRSKLSDLE